MTPTFRTFIVVHIQNPCSDSLPKFPVAIFLKLMENKRERHLNMKKQLNLQFELENFLSHHPLEFGHQNDQHMSQNPGKPIS
jgi:hypothetical protein